MLNTWYFNLWLLIIYCYHYLLNIQFDLSIHESYLYRFLVLFNFKDYGRIGSSRGTVPPILCLRLLTLVTLKFTLLSLVTVHYILKKNWIVGPFEVYTTFFFLGRSMLSLVGAFLRCRQTLNCSRVGFLFWPYRIYTIWRKLIRTLLPLLFKKPYHCHYYWLEINSYKNKSMLFFT